MNPDVLKRLLDKPVHNHQVDGLPDLLNHGNVADRVVSAIEHVPPEEESPCIAIFGPWGTGKTGILNLIGRRLDKDKYIWRRVDAWHNQVSDLVVLEIVRVLFDEVSPDLKNSLLRLLWAFSSHSINSSATSFLPSGVKLEDIAAAIYQAYPKGFPPSREQLIKAEFGQIIDKLTENGPKRVVVAIDNLDRCRPEAAIHVLEILNLITHVPKCAFVVAADQNALVSFLNREYKGTDFSGTKYLEKIFPYYFRVPDPWVAWSHAEVKKERDEVCALLEFLIDEDSHWRKDEQTFRMLWHYCSQPRALRNPRRIKRILRRILEFEFESEKLNGQPQAAFAQNLLFLVILSDLWPEAYEFYMTTNHNSWRAWLEFMAQAKGEPHENWVLTGDRDLQGFLYEVMKFNNRTFDNTTIAVQKDLAVYLRDVGKLGL